MDEAIGGTNFWDSMDWVLKDLIPQASGARRSAIVVMTDGIDNALPEVPGPGLQPAVSRLIEKIRELREYRVSDLSRYEEENVKLHPFRVRRTRWRANSSAYGICLRYALVSCGAA